MAELSEVVDLTLVDTDSDEDEKFDDKHVKVENMIDDIDAQSCSSSLTMSVEPAIVIDSSEEELFENESFEESNSEDEQSSDDMKFKSSRSKKPPFYDGDPTLPVFRWTSSKHHFSVEELGEILLGDTVPADKICFRQPTQICHNSTFVVDVRALNDPSDMRADENGVWQRKGAPIAFISVFFPTNCKSGEKIKIFRRNSMKPRSNCYKLSRTYYVHSSSPDFHRIITLVNDCNGEIQRYAFVQYSFDRFEHHIDLKPHGNSKGKKPFNRTKPSVIKLLKASSSDPPRKILREVENRQGGVMGAKSGCDLPRNKKQIKNIKQACVRSKESSQNSASSDVLAHVMHMCKSSVGSSETFVRCVEAAPEPMCVLATNQQLVDVERFCTGSPSSVLSIDPTFNLGPFYVTPTTYHNLLVETSSGSNPILLGPILIHQTKTFRPFHYLASALISLNSQLRYLKAFGSDGEPELIKAFNVAFPEAVHLRCTNHIRKNIKDKLQQLGLPQDVSKEILADIFGTQAGTHFEAGLADAISRDSFCKALESLKPKWNNLEKSCSPLAQPNFHAWFCRYKSKEFVESILPEVRCRAGCKNPTSFFTTNSSESINHVIKQEVEWKENQLPQLIEKLKCIVEDNQTALQRAVINRGEWHFTSQYDDLIVVESRWFKLSEAMKKAHMKKVFNQALKPSVENSDMGHLVAGSSTSSSSCLSISVEASGISNVSMSTLQNIWAKAEQLIKDSHIAKVPWSDDDGDKFVKSYSSDQPHLVTRSKKNKFIYCCDKNCPMYKGFSLCSHTIATAQVNGDLKSFLDRMRETVPNLTAISMDGMPSGTGRKGGVTKRKRTRAAPIQSRSVRPCLESQVEVSREKSTVASPPVASVSVCPPSLCPPTPSNMTLSSAVSVSPSFSVQTIRSDSQSVLSPGVNASQPNFFTPGFNSSQQAFPSMPGLNMSQPVFPSSPGFNSSQSVNMNASTSFDTSLRRAFSGTGASSNLCASTKNPFVVKLKNNKIRVCQSCRKGFDGPNDTMGLVVARAERRLVSNLATGSQFLGKECNSHYHLHALCLRAADKDFRSEDLVLSDGVKEQLNDLQKVYLMTCFKMIL